MVVFKLFGNLAAHPIGGAVTAVDVQRAHTADTLAAVVVERHGLLALVDQVVVQNIQHLEKRGDRKSTRLNSSH